MQEWQVLLIVLISFLYRIDRSGTQLVGHNAIFYGTLVGLILGDIKMGMMVGATIQLMSLGVAAIGGSSVPDYPLATIIAATIAISTGQGLEAGLMLGLPVGMLAIQLDVMDKIFNGFIARQSQRYANEGQFKKMMRILWICPVVHGLTVAIPVWISITLGKTFIEMILAAMPVWFTGGLSVAGKLLPIVGISVLLHYMPMKKYIEYLLIGFVCAAYLQIPMLGVSIVGTALAYKLYKDRLREDAGAAAVAAGGDDEDE